MKIRTIVGLVMMLGGFSFLGIGGFILQEAVVRNSGDEDLLRVAETTCREQIVKIGTFAPKPENIVEVTIKDVVDPRLAMADITSIVAACPTREVTASCIGTTCGAKGEPGPLKAIVTLALK